MDLAVFSGSPFFAVPQHVGGPVVEPEVREGFHRLADAAFGRNQLTNSGPLAARLEEEVAVRHRVGDAVLVANATLAQMLLLRALGLTSGEALLSANTFVSTAHACEWLGMRPIFCDIDPDTLNLSPVDCERKITAAARAIIPTHVFGVMADMPVLADMAARRGVRLLADAAHAFDCDFGGVPPGGFGAPEFISFHATKYFSSLEGGVILTGDPALADELRILRNFGFSRPFDACGCGINAKMSEISAAFALASLPFLDRRRRGLGEVHAAYRRELADVPGLRIHPVDRLGRNNYRYFALFVDESAFGLSRDGLLEALRLENVLARHYFYPGCHRMGYYQDRLPRPELPATDRALAAIMALPTSFVGLEPVAAAKSIAGLIQAIHERAGEVGLALRKTK
ncbi:MAG: DegT/DnrJ/EryC1/StrS family aminotransferase [Planctomycetota bacterium]|jgi:dTDP-4-amino-4,6-dideoxygalactose transaminase|nr:DegT/DnrJ/EryC1/StrS family aminotransferase [Planctomycetota bacterium]